MAFVNFYPIGSSRNEFTAPLAPAAGNFKTPQPLYTLAYTKRDPHAETQRTRRTPLYY